MDCSVGFPVCGGYLYENNVVLLKWQKCVFSKHCKKNTFSLAKNMHCMAVM